MRALALCGFLGLAGCAAATPPAASLESPEAQFAFVDFDAAAFDRARSENKIVLIDVVADWCHWCHVMDDKTYGDARVRALLAEHFVVIRVDSDTNPDIAERYLAWGWPATAILTPNAEPVMELRGYQPPDRFESILRELVEAHVTESLRGRRSPPAAQPLPVDELEGVRRRALAQLDAAWDPAVGGWGGPKKYPYGPALEWSAYACARGEASACARLEQTLDGVERLADPVWGGVYQYSVGGVWTRPHFEQLAKVQAMALQSFALAGRVERARAIAGFVDAFLATESGTFGSSIDADFRSPERRVVGADYWQLDDAGRREIGLPRRDLEAYANDNGRLISARARLYARTGNAADLEPALEAYASLARSHRLDSGGWRHFAGDEGRLHLADQAAMLWAELWLYEATGEAPYLHSATRTAEAALSLQGPTGAFLSAEPDPEARGVFARARVPLEDGSLLARGFLRLHEASHHDESGPWLRAAREALAGLAGEARWQRSGRNVGTFVLGLYELLEPRIRVDVVGPVHDPRSRALRALALAWDEPRKVVTSSSAGERYPGGDAPRIYACTANACSAPISDPRKANRALSDFVERALR